MATSVVTTCPWARRSGLSTLRRSAMAAGAIPNRLRVHRKTAAASAEARITTGRRPQKSSRSPSFHR